MYMCVCVYLYIWIWVTAYPPTHPPTPKSNHPLPQKHKHNHKHPNKWNNQQVFQKGLQEDPYHCPLYQAFGMLLADLGRVDAARYVQMDGHRWMYYYTHAWHEKRKDDSHPHTLHAHPHPMLPSTIPRRPKHPQGHL